MGHETSGGLQATRAEVRLVPFGACLLAGMNLRDGLQNDCWFGGTLERICDSSCATPHLVGAKVPLL